MSETQITSVAAAALAALIYIVVRSIRRRYYVHIWQEDEE